MYESFVLKWINDQVTLRSNQFGGVKGCGTYLVDLWQQVLENLEDPRAASLITSIDYAKAFNRLDFEHCLKSLARKGLSGNLIRILASFLTGRVMRVKVGNTLSTKRAVQGGVPQGSLLGVFLFNSAIDDFESASKDIQNYNTTGSHSQQPPFDPEGPTLEPVPPEPTGRDYRHLPPFVVELLQVLKYVDDNVIHEKLNFDNITEDGYGVRDKLAVRTQNLFRLIVYIAESCGMKVNGSKTQSLCISELKGYTPRAHFRDSEGALVRAGDEMTILGFAFSSNPDMSAHVELVKSRFRARLWALRHLRHNGFSDNDLLTVYKSVIVPEHDYCSCVYHSSLTIT